jgi:two-component sensor histidine kinase
MIFTTDIGGKINKMNSAAKNELQVSFPLIGKSLSILFSSEEEGKRVMQQLEKEKSFTGEVWFQRSDQTTFPAYLSLSFLYNSEEVVLGIMGVSRNISDVKAKEIEIKEQAAKLNAIIESSSHFFFTVDKTYNITSYNQGFMSDVTNNIGKSVGVGQPFKSIFPTYLKEKHQELERFWKQKFNAAFRGESVKFEIERKDTRGNTYYREIYLNPIYSDKGEVLEVSGIGHDITDKKLSEANLVNSLKEKEVLLKEVHHRVKNNMQVISSILSLQSAYVKDESILDILKESQNRIKSMAFIHEKLYRTKDFSQIKFSEYLKNLAKNLIETYELSRTKVILNTELDEIYLNLDEAIPCGLIVNELISNSLKYAFIEKERGIISLSLTKEKSKVKLVIADNGSGLSEDIDYQNTDSLGLQLVNTLVEQLEGEIELMRDGGTKFTITFELNE